MSQIMNYPVILSVLTLVLLSGFAWLGSAVRRRRKGDEDLEKDEYTVVLGATLTLLGLLIGFSFSMAISRYDQRKDYEEEEANAIGTEYQRADLMPDAAKAVVQAQLVRYLDLRIQRYQAHASVDVTDLANKTAQLQNEMWSTVSKAAVAQRDPISAVVVTGMNDVINRQGYTQAARWKRIPLPAWALMIVIALFSNFLIGYGEKRAQAFTLLVVPLAIAASFLLIADVDSPQGGLIRIAPQNMMTLADSLKPK
ncbi:bestrophin-like domain [Occallatibacter riparius]|uniref:DUF4239 domain-containing protein n=1 Tax=Occallatibacter riparius TaxID=1002689 RepID=A0A9J7BXH8_9BACT|nr:hypothetical protein [Occallatibacter riparius]UWZ85877.1 hypothetical protein MOP44_08025 [Occallatibacter riparius]